MNLDPQPSDGSQLDPDAAAPFAVRAVLAGVRFCGYLSAALILVALGLVAYAIFQRYVMGSPLLWGDELLGYVLVALVMLGAAEALRRGDHISMDLISAHAKGRFGWALGIWSHLAVLAFAGVLGWSTWEAVRFAHDFGSYSSGYIEIATWIPQAPMLLGSALLALVALVRLVQAIVRGPSR